MTNNSIADTSRQLRHATVQKIAADYQQRGYRVVVSPRSVDLPAFLKEFHPDLIAEGDDNSYVVEVRTQHGRHEDDWGELAKVINNQPGWHLQLVVDNNFEPKARVSLTPEQVAAQLRESEQLVCEGRLEAGLLLLWSATEAAMRLLAERTETELHDFRASTLISTLYTEGRMDREDYDILMQSLRIRNTVAHGFQPENSLDEVIAILQGTVQRLQQEGLEPVSGRAEITDFAGEGVATNG